MEQQMQHEYLMEDSTMVKVAVHYDSWSRGAARYLDLLLRQMRDIGDMIVGFDTEWSFNQPDCNTMVVVLLNLCTQAGCVVIKLEHNYSSGYLKDFLINKDIVFAGVHIKKDLKKLQKEYGLEIRNAVDLSEMAATVLHQPRLNAFGVRRLASEVLLEPWKPRPHVMAGADWCATPLANDQIECATVDAYAAYKIAKKLLG